jgi:hypothetical protein
MHAQITEVIQDSGIPADPALRQDLRETLQSKITVDLWKAGQRGLPVAKVDIAGLLKQHTEKYIKAPDPALMEEIQSLQQEMYAPFEAANAVSEKGMDTVAVPPASSPQDEVRYFVAEEKDGHISRLVLVYPMPYLRRTIVQVSWNLGDYPSAWPQDEPAGPEDGTAL